MREIKQDLKQLVETAGISGFEHDVRALIAEKIIDACDELVEDAYGNLVARCGAKDG